MNNHPAGSATGIDLAALEQLARAATPGPWMRLFGERTVYDRMEDGCRGNAIARADVAFSSQDADNLDFIAAANPAAVLALIALARATPQHSVTEQASEHEAFKAAMVAKHYVGSMFDYFLAEDEITYHDPVANQMYDAWQAARAQPLASTAATQPEQARAVQIFTCVGKGGEYEMIGYSNGAGPKRGESIVVYRDIKQLDIFYHRSADDFKARMQWLGTRAALAIPASTATTQQENEQAKVCTPMWQDDEGNFGEAIRRCATCGTYEGNPCRIVASTAASEQTKTELCAPFPGMDEPWADGKEAELDAALAPYETDAVSEPPILQARSPEGDPWVNVTPEQYAHAAKNGYETRMLANSAASEQQASVSDEQYQEILRPVLSRYGMHRYLNGDSITLDPSDYRAIIDSARAALSGRATIPSEADERARRNGAHLLDFARRIGWGDDEDEGAFEFVTRRFYEQGQDNAEQPNVRAVVKGD